MANLKEGYGTRDECGRNFHANGISIDNTNRYLVCVKAVPFKYTDASLLLTYLPVSSKILSIDLSFNEAFSAASEYQLGTTASVPAYFSAAATSGGFRVSAAMSFSPNWNAIADSAIYGNVTNSAATGSGTLRIMYYTT